MATPYAYFQGQFMPLSEAKIGIVTHAFNYGTAVFEGVRGNWNADEGQRDQTRGRVGAIFRYDERSAGIY